MNKIIFSFLLLFFPYITYAEDIPDPNTEGVKKVLGTVIEVVRIDASKRGSATTNIPVADLVESIFGTNYEGFPIYHVKVNETIILEVASQVSFKVGDCVLVWYDGAMGESPNLSMLGQGGILKSRDCNK